MDQNTQTIIFKHFKNQTHYPIELNYNFCSCMILISSKIFNASYTVSINYDEEECDIKCLTNLQSKKNQDKCVELEYDSFYNKLNLYCKETCPKDTIFTIKIIY